MLGLRPGCFRADRVGLALAKAAKRERDSEATYISSLREEA